MKLFTGMKERTLRSPLPFPFLEEKKRGFFLLCSFLFFPAIFFLSFLPPHILFSEEGWETSGVVISRWDQDLKKEFRTENSTEFHTRIFGEIKGEKGPYRITLSGLFRHELLAGGGKERTSVEGLLWEGYLSRRYTLWEWKAGQFLRRWGKGVPTLWDILNPSDFREGLFIEDEFQKIPIPMGQVVLYRDWEIEVLYIPFYYPLLLPDPRSDFSPIRVGTLEGIEEFPIVESSLDQGIFPGTIQYPKKDLLHPEGGLRLSRSFSDWDLDLYLFTGYDRVPFPIFSPEFLIYLNQPKRNIARTLQNLGIQEVLLFTPLYRIEPKRQYFSGFSIQKPVGSVTLRGEGQWVLHQGVYREDLAFLYLPALFLLAGVDSFTREEFMYTIALIHLQFFSPPSLFLLKKANTVFMGVFRGTIPRTSFSWEIRGIQNLTLGDLWIRPQVTYLLSSGLYLEGGYQGFFGKETTPFGSFKHNEGIYLRLRYWF
jgi:hypothetical protein